MQTSVVKCLKTQLKKLLDEKYRRVDAKFFFDEINTKEPIYASQCKVGRDIYEKERKVDFILYHPIHWESCLVIQCKWQASGGSVDEKYPFEVESIKLNQYETIIILDGGGLLSWCREVAQKTGR